MNISPDDFEKLGMMNPIWMKKRNKQHINKVCCPICKAMGENRSEPKRNSAD